MEIKSKTGKLAVRVTSVAALFVFISFCTPYWVVYDGKIVDPKFIRIGLWEACFQNFEDNRQHNDSKLTGCWWIYEEEYYIIFDSSLPGYFMESHIFFLICMTLVLIAVFLTWIYCSRDHDKYLLLLLSNAASLIISGFCGLIAVCLFGGNGHRTWKPHWQHNHFSWSFAFAFIGSLLLLLAGYLFLLEAKRTRYRRLQGFQPLEKLGLDPYKPFTHHI